MRVYIWNYKTQRTWGIAGGITRVLHHFIVIFHTLTLAFKADLLPSCLPPPVTPTTRSEFWGMCPNIIHTKLFRIGNVILTTQSICSKLYHVSWDTRYTHRASTRTKARSRTPSAFTMTMIWKMDWAEN